MTEKQVRTNLAEDITSLLASAKEMGVSDHPEWIEENAMHIEQVAKVLPHYLTATFKMLQGLVEVGDPDDCPDDFPEENNTPHYIGGSGVIAACSVIVQTQVVLHQCLQRVGMPLAEANMLREQLFGVMRAVANALLSLDESPEMRELGDTINKMLDKDE